MNHIYFKRLQHLIIQPWRKQHILYYVTALLLGLNGVLLAPKLVQAQSGVPLDTFPAWLSQEVEHTTSVAWGDMDGDGDLDLAVGGEQNRVYLNQDGVLQSVAVWTSAPTDMTESVAWGDIDRDGDLDLATGGSGPNKVYLNQDGVLQTTAAWVSDDETGTSSVAWGDMDQDGDLDLATGGSGPNKVYLNQDGVLQTTTSWVSEISGYDSDAPPNVTWSVAWGDVDGDGDLDLAAGHAENDSLVYIPGHSIIYLNNKYGGDLQTTAAWTSYPTDATYSVAWGDVDGDGDLDLAAGNGKNWLGVSEPNTIYLNHSRSLQVDDDTWFHDFNYSLAWGDVDGDGDLDLAAGNLGGVLVYLNENGILQEATTVDGYETINSVAWGDVDRDGDLDLAAGGEQQTKVYLNENGVLQSPAIWTSEDMGYVSSVAWGDMDMDGDLDLAVGSEQNRVYLNQDGVLQTSNIWVANEIDSTSSVAWGDVDRDGDLDLAVGNDGQNKIYLNQGGILQSIATWISDESDDTSSVAWGDMDGDGDLDLAVGNYRKPNKVYLNQDGRLQTTATWGSGDADDTTSIAWGDMDGDGDLDLATVSVNLDASKIYLNQDGRLQPTSNFTIRSAEGHTHSVAWGDYDGDGDLDLVVGGRFDTQIYRNNRQGGQNLPDNLPYLKTTPPYPSVNASFYASSTILNSPTLSMTYTLFDLEGDSVRFIKAFYSPNGGGQWFPATPEAGTFTTDLSTQLSEYQAKIDPEEAGSIPSLGTISSTLVIPTSQIINDIDVWLTINHYVAGDLDVYLESPQGTLVELFTDVDGSGEGFEHTILDDEASVTIEAGTAPFTGRFQPEGSLADFDGEVTDGVWTLWVTDDDTPEYGGGIVSWGIYPQTESGTHTFAWDADEDLVKSDNIVFRIEAYQGFTSPGPYQRPYASTQTFSFRYAAPQYIKVVDEAGNPVPNAEIYRDGVSIGQTSQAGLLNPGPLEIGDELAVLALQHQESTIRGQHDEWAYRTYLTNIEVDELGHTTPFTVNQPQGEQLLVVRPEQTLILFNLLVSIEWDATDEYVADTQAAFDAAADFLYDVTDGQMTFGQVAIYDNAEYWTEADIQITTKNAVTPHAFIGGITSEDTSHIIRVGRFWNGNSADQGPWSASEGYRTLVHEFGHYGLGLYDEYFGYLKEGDKLVGERRTVCIHKDNRKGLYDASIMDYHYTTSELADVGRWASHCQKTAQHQLNNGEAAWQTLARLYDDHSDEPQWHLVSPDVRAGVGQSVPGPEMVPAVLPFPIVTTTNVGNDPKPFTLQVCHNGTPYQAGTWVTLTKTKGTAMDQGLTDEIAGHIEILGATGTDSLKIVSLDGALSADRQVDQILSIGYLELNPNASSALATQSVTTGPYLRLSPTTSNGNLDGLLLVVTQTLSTDNLKYALTGPDQIGPANIVIPYNFEQKQHEVSAFFIPPALSGYANVYGTHNGQFIDLNVDYRLQQTLNISDTNLFSNDGNLKLHLEPGSFPLAEVHFLIASPWGLPSPLPTGLAAVGEVYEITASGNMTTLEKPAVLTFHYDSETMAGFDSESVTIYQWDPATATWHPMDTDHSPDDQEVSTVMTDLGVYALLGNLSEITSRSHSNDVVCGIALSESIYLPLIRK